MTSDPTAEQGELRRKGRQRLIGAVTLALLAAVFIPMLLDSEPRQKRSEPSLAIPAKDTVPPLAAALSPQAPAKDAEPAAAATPAAAAQGDAAAKAPAEPPEPATPAVPEPRKSVEPKAAEFKGLPARAPSPALAEPKPSESPGAPKLVGFAVQVGAFKDDAKLAQARDKLSAARLPHYTERLSTPSGELTRLRAGPFPARPAAEKAAADMKRAGLEGRVVALP